MTEPDGPRYDNDARVRDSGTAYQAGEIGGDAHLGNSTSSRSTTVSLGAFGVIAGVVLTLAVGFTAWKLIATDGPADGSPVTTQNGSASRTSAPANGPQAKEIRLTRETGADVDGDDNSARPSAGATDDTDLYLTDRTLLEASGTGFLTDRGHEDGAEKRCTDAVTARKNNEPGALPTTMGTQYCFRTSDGQIGWARVKTVALGVNDPDGFIVFSVRVWRN